MVSVIGRQDRVFASALGDWRDNFGSSAFDQQSVTGAAGLAHTFANKDVVSVSGQVQGYWLGHDPYRTAYGAIVQFTRPLPGGRALSISAQVNRFEVFASGNAVPRALTGSMTVGFGSTVRFGFDGTITMPEASGPVTYTYYSVGRSAGQSQDGIVDPHGFVLFGKLNGSGAACILDDCSFAYYGNFAEANPQERFGAIYQTYGNYNPFVSERIQGSAVFAQPGTSSTGSTPDGSQMSGYTGGFNAAAPTVSFITTLKLGNGTVLAGSESGFVANPYILTSNGGLASYTRAGNITRTNGTMVIEDVYGNADAIIGRWNNGTNTGANTFTLTADQGFHYFLARELPTEFALPISGQVNYSLVAATKPTMVNAQLASGAFDARMVLTYGSSVFVAMEGSITMLRTGTNYVYRFSTPGGVANASQSTTALTYSAVQPETPQDLIGAAIFAADPVTPPTTSTTRSGQYIAYVAHPIGIDLRTTADVVYNTATNAPLAYTSTRNANSIANEHPTIGSATAHESGALGTTIGWTRWAGGTTGGQYFSDTDGITFTDNQGWHMIVGDPAINLPASSVVTYALAGATAPTIRSGRAAPGVFSGGLGVSFGRVSKVGLDFKVSIDGSSYGFNTPGGVVAPQLGLTVNSDNTFVTSTALAVNGTGSVCPAGNCTAQAWGFLAGSGASAVGIAYTFNNCLGFNTTVDGVAAFSKVP